MLDLSHNEINMFEGLIHVGDSLIDLELQNNQLECLGLSDQQQNSIYGL